MRIVIVGCGKVGSTIAKSLAVENHDIVVIDKDSEKVNKLLSEVDCMGIVGNGVIQQVLLEAGVDKADYLIACTSSDEINILSCLMARRNSKCKTISRMRNPEYANQIEYIMNELNISLTINPDLATAHEIARNIRFSNSLSTESFFKGRLNLHKISIPDDSKVIGMKLAEITKNYKLSGLICMIERGDDVFIPTGSSIIKKGDNVFIIARSHDAFKYFDTIGYKYKPIKSYMIIGGSRIARYLFDILNRDNNASVIKLIEKDHNKCVEIADKNPNVSVVCADATDKETLIREGMNDTDAFIALTGIDEENILLSLFANVNQKTKVITKVNHLNFIDSLKEIKLGSVINPEKIAADIIIRYIRGNMNAGDSNIETLHRLCNDRVEALGFKIRSESDITNKRIMDIKLKNNVLIAGIFRKNQVIIPNGQDVINVGDSVVIITKDNKFNDILDILA